MQAQAVSCSGGLLLTQWASSEVSVILRRTLSEARTPHLPCLCSSGRLGHGCPGGTQTPGTSSSDVVIWAQGPPGGLPGKGHRGLRLGAGAPAALPGWDGEGCECAEWGSAGAPALPQLVIEAGPQPIASGFKSRPHQAPPSLKPPDPARHTPRQT